MSTGHLVKRTRKVIMPPDEAKWTGVTGEVYTAPDKPSPIEGGRTAIMITIMAERAREKGVEIFTSSPVKKILMENGRVTGIVAEVKGERTQVACKFVVIATGGFCHNKEMVNKYIGFEVGTDILVLHGVELTGDCIQMAWDLKATQDYMAPAILTEPLLPYEPNLRSAFNQPFNLVVNQDGKRFVNEEKLGANWVHLAYAMARQGNKCAYVIFDENIRRHMEEYGFEYIHYLFRPIRVKLNGEQFDEAVKKALESKHSFLVVAGSLEELSYKIDVKPSILKETIDEYNSYCKKGYDALFNKNPRYLIPIEQPRYYATKYVLYMYTTVGGIKINERAEVLSKNDRVIPGLYAAGDCAASVLAYDFSLSYMLCNIVSASNPNIL
ncbi:MAG: FAD-binding protein [Candidatus Bathyarchaeia archaeon]